MSYLQSLPVPLRRLLAAGGLNGAGRYVDPLDDHQAEEVARLALTAGIRTKGPVLEYVVRYLRWQLTGAGDRPTPPGLSAPERAYVNQRLDELSANLPRIAPPETITIQPDPNGYTPPDNVLSLDEARRARGA